MSNTSRALKKKHGVIIAWSRANGFDNCFVNAVLHRRKRYAYPDYEFSPTSQGYAVLYTLIKDGFAEELLKDGWNTSYIDIDTPLLPATNNSKQAWISVVHKDMESKLIDISNSLCDLGDGYTNSIFFAHAEGGPVAVMFMMQKEDRATIAATLFLIQNYPMFEFFKESADVISIWTK